MKIPDPLKQQIFDLQAPLLDLIDGAATTERELFENYGETRATQSPLDILLEIKIDTEETYGKFSLLMSNIAKEAPDATFDNMRSLRQNELRVRENLSSSVLTIQQIRGDWSLP